MMAKVAGKPQQKATFWMGKFESGPNQHDQSCSIGSSKAGKKRESALISYPFNKVRLGCSENCSDQLQRFRRCQADVSNGVCAFYSKSVIEFEAKNWLNYDVDEFQLLVECWKESARTWPGSILDYLMEGVQRA